MRRILNVCIPYVIYIYRKHIPRYNLPHVYCSNVIVSTMASQITGVSIVCSTVCVREIHRWQVDFPPKKPVTQKMFPFDDVIMQGIYSIGPNNNQANYVCCGCCDVTFGDRSSVEVALCHNGIYALFKSNVKRHRKSWHYPLWAIIPNPNYGCFLC